MSSKNPWKPTTCDAPDLASLSGNLVVEGVLRMLFHSAESANPKTRALRFGYLRLVDKCTFEYQQGRALLSEYVNTQPDQSFSRLLHAASHFETCINSIKRSIVYLNALRRDQDGPTISKNIGVLRNETRIRRVRDAIEHTDQDILRGTIGPGDPHLILVKGTGVALGGEEISYQELAKWIEQLHEEAHRVAGHNAK